MDFPFGVPELAFSEIEDIISPSGNPEDKIMFNELCKTINAFISTLSE